MVGEVTVNSKTAPSNEVNIHLYFKNQKENLNLQNIPQSLHNKIHQQLKRHQFKGEEGEIVFVEDINTTIVIFGRGEKKDDSLIKFRDVLSGLLRILASKHYHQVSLWLDDKVEDYFQTGKQIALAFFLSNYHFVQFKGEKAKNKVLYLDQLNLLTKAVQDKVAAMKQGISYGRQIAAGIFLARDLVNQPASHVTPEVLMQTAFDIEKNAQTKNIKVEILDKDECKKLGMGAYLSVAQGSDKEPKFILLHYLPEKKARKKICLIGKSLTFDSGGISLKPALGMEEMKIDMAGGAAVLGVFQVLAENKDYFQDLEVWGVLPACENMPSGQAVKPGDVVTALNGKTIEVINTDAEGRLTLADALAYSEKYLKPDMVIDLATLTGACIIALGKKITGMLGNNEKLLTDLEEISRNEGEELWRLPLYKPYLKAMESEIADLKNVGNNGAGGGTLTAAIFLAEFVEKTPWVHLDIAGSSFNNSPAEGIFAHGGTGWGVMTLLEFLRKL